MLSIIVDLEKEGQARTMRLFFGRCIKTRVQREDYGKELTFEGAAFSWAYAFSGRTRSLSTTSKLYAFHPSG